ncbi:hypothetical protein C0993_000406, partial [Termitomyces sp. T159_Od127]
DSRLPPSTHPPPPQHSPTHLALPALPSTPFPPRFGLLRLAPYRCSASVDTV